MKNSVIILGANGRFGRAASKAFSDSGWNVTAVVRPGKIPATTSSLTYIEADAEDPQALAIACQGASVIVNALIPPYDKWATLLPRLTESVIGAARATGATVLFPGNVYNYGKQMPLELTAETTQKSDGKGAMRIALEKSYRDASDIQTIILRGGDFIEKERTGNWFDAVITGKIARGRITYPGPTNIPHAWAYLPDMARAAVKLCEIRNKLDRFNDIPFAGYTLTGDELIAAVQTAFDTKLKRSHFSWPLIWIVSLVSPVIREARAMRYLWNRPHSLNGSAMRRLLPGFVSTPVNTAMKEVFNT